MNEDSNNRREFTEEEKTEEEIMWEKLSTLPPPPGWISPEVGPYDPTSLNEDFYFAQVHYVR